MITFKEVNALEESMLRMEYFEQKYGITSESFAANNYGSAKISESDENSWDFHIQCFLMCGGDLKEFCTKEDHEEIIDNANETVYTTENNELMVKNNMRKGRDKTSLPFLLLQRLAQNFVNFKIPAEQLSSYSWRD